MSILPMRPAPSSLRPIIRSIQARRALKRLPETFPSLLFAIFKALRIVKSPIDSTGLADEPLRYESAAGLQTLAPPLPETVSVPMRRHPIVGTLRRRAAIELLAWLGVYWVPGRFLKTLETEPDPGRAIELFAQRLGCRPDSLRHRDPSELARFRTAMTLLRQIETDSEAMTQGQARHLEYLLYRQRFKRAHEVRSAIAVLNEARRFYRNSELPEIAWLRREAKEVEKRHGSILGVLDTDVPGMASKMHESERLVRRFDLAVQRLKSLAPTLKALEGALGEEPSGWLSFQQMLEQLDAITGLLEKNEEADVPWYVDQYDQIVRCLEAEVTRATQALQAARKPRFKRTRQRPIIAESLEQAALDYFGLAAERLTTKLIEDAFAARITQIYEIGQEDGAIVRATRMRDAIFWREILVETIRH